MKKAEGEAIMTAEIKLTIDMPEIADSPVVSLDQIGEWLAWHFADAGLLKANPLSNCARPVITKFDWSLRDGV